MRTFNPLLALGMVAMLLGACAKDDGQYQAKRVLPQEVQNMLAKGDNPLIGDVRSERAFHHEHIKNAVNIPFATVQNGTVRLPKDRWMVLY